MSRRVPADLRSACASRVQRARAFCAHANGLRAFGAGLVAATASLTGCVGVFADLHATGYPALHTAPHPTEGTLPDGPKPIDQVKAAVGLGVTVGVELDDGRTSRWAVGYSADLIEGAGGANAHHHFNDLRLDVTVKTIDDDNRLRLGVGGGIGAGNTKLPRDDGGTYSKGSGSAVFYSGPVFVHYIGNHSSLMAMLGGSYLIIGAGDWNVRGWGLTTHLTYTYAFDDSHPDVVLYHAVRPGITMADFVVAGQRIGCVAGVGEDDEEEVPAAYLACGEERMELHAPEELVHVHCERSTTARCRALFTRLEEALPKK